jgi:hypothetical protein
MISSQRNFEDFKKTYTNPFLGAFSVLPSCSPCSTKLGLNDPSMYRLHEYNRLPLLSWGHEHMEDMGT